MDGHYATLKILYLETLGDLVIGGCKKNGEFSIINLR
jgi:hypothetical protein